MATRRDVAYVSGAGKDVLYAVGQYVEENQAGPKVVLFDFPRSTKGFISYPAIEKCKDGIFFSGKYESKAFIMNVPHVVCFSNTKPKLDEMSMDRWKLIDLMEFDY